MAGRSRKLNTDAGFSLIELIVVVIIMSVLAGSAVIGISQVMRTNVTTAADKLAAVYDRAQYENLYLDGEVVFRLEYANEQYEAVIMQYTTVGGEQSRELSRETIADGKVTITAVKSDGGKESVSVLMPVTIAFDKSSGAMKPTEQGGLVYTYTGIRLQNASKKAEVVLVEHTGRCFVDKDPDW